MVFMYKETDDFTMSQTLGHSKMVNFFASGSGLRWVWGDHNVWEASKIGGRWVHGGWGSPKVEAGGCKEVSKVSK